MKNREIIIRRALQLFRKFGVKSMSVEKLTRELQLSRRALYAMFVDKEGLLAACLDLNYREEIQEFEQIKAQARDPLEAYILAGRRVMEREFSLNPNFYHDILYYYPELRDKAIQVQDNFNRKQLAGLFADGIREGLIVEQTDPLLAAEVIILLYESLFRVSLDQDFAYPKPERIQQAIQPYIRGLCTDKGLEKLHQYQQAGTITAPESNPIK
jgi:AcrR family transcriptional regulator